MWETRLGGEEKRGLRPQWFQSEALGAPKSALSPPLSEPRFHEAQEETRGLSKCPHYFRGPCHGGMGGGYLNGSSFQVLSYYQESVSPG